MTSSRRTGEQEHGPLFIIYKLRSLYIFVYEIVLLREHHG
jgi:hypothetical protein